MMPPTPKDMLHFQPEVDLHFSPYAKLVAHSGILRIELSIPLCDNSDPAIEAARQGDNRPMKKLIAAFADKFKNFQKWRAG